MYKLTISYDGKPFAVWNYSDAIEAVHNFDKCSDYGDAKEYATVNLFTPSSKCYTKIFYREGRKVITK